MDREAVTAGPSGGINVGVGTNRRQHVPRARPRPRAPPQDPESEAPDRARPGPATHHPGESPRARIRRLLAVVCPPLPPLPPPLTHIQAEPARRAAMAQSPPARTAPAVRSRPTPASTTPSQSAEGRTGPPAHASARHARRFRSMMQTRSPPVAAVESDTTPRPPLHKLSPVRSPLLPPLLSNSLLLCSTRS